MATKPELPQEEIDLGTLFGQIGKMFSNFFSFFGNIFKSIYHYCIVFLLFIRKNILILGLATLIGAIAGFVLDLTKEDIYSSEMIVETAYGSSNHLFKQIEYLNVLISEEDSTEIGNIFDLPSTEGAKLTGFEIAPLDEAKYYHLAYDDFKQSNDTTYTRDINYEDFLNRIMESDLTFFSLNASSTKSEILPKLNNNFATFIENEYFKNLRNKKITELQFEKEKLENNLFHIDSLRKRYKETAYLQFEEKDQDNSGVSFRTINAGYKGNVDIDLYYQSDSILVRLRELNELIVENEKIIKVQSGFTVGEQKGRILNNNWLRFGFLGFFVTFLILVGIQFNRYLNNYEQKRVK